MKNSSLVLMSIAVVAVGAFALPGSVSLFSGQHTWYGLNNTGNQVPCEKCHQDIQDEMMSSTNGVHKSLDADPGAESCLCHRVTSATVKFGTGVADGDGDASNPGTEAHAAATIACMVCHEKNVSNTYYPFAGGFNEAIVYGMSDPPATKYDYGDGTDGEKAAHNAFIKAAIDDTLMEDSNEACIACHTRIGVNITWTKKENLVFTSDETTGEWVMSAFTATGSNQTEVTTKNTWTNP